MRQIPVGAKGSFSLLVQPEHLADRFKDATLPPVLATPVTIMVMENAALNAIRAYLDRLPDAITIQLADIFSGDIDFYHDLRRGDRFTVVYEMRELDGTAIGAGRILAAEFVNKGITFRAFLWHARDGGEAYYAEDGKSLRKAFMRSPVEFTRITSGFSLARFHPFLQTWRAHKGVDFAAPTGTPCDVSGLVCVAGRLVARGRPRLGDPQGIPQGGPDVCLGSYSRFHSPLCKCATGI